MSEPSRLVVALHRRTQFAGLDALRSCGLSSARPLPASESLRLQREVGVTLREKVDGTLVSGRFDSWRPGVGLIFGAVPSIGGHCWFAPHFIVSGSPGWFEGQLPEGDCLKLLEAGCEGLAVATPDLSVVALFDRVDGDPLDGSFFEALVWRAVF